MSAIGFLHPVLALIIWTLLVWVIMYARRIPAMQAARIHPETAKSPDGDWKSKLPLKTQAVAHNYNHLMEQPTLFYALMFYLYLTENTGMVIFYLACAYVLLRIGHTLVQIQAGKVMIRFSLFTLSTLCLIGMVVMSFFGLK